MSEYFEESRQHWGEHVFQALEKLFYNKSFIERVEKIRNKVGIPLEGFNDVQKYWKFLKLNPDEAEVIKKESRRVVVERKYPIIYSIWVESFIGVDFECIDYVFPFQDKIIPGHGYAFVTHNDYFEFRLYKGAPINGFLRFIRKYFYIVKEHSKGSDIFPNVRKNPLTRNREILKLHESGELDVIGIWQGYRLGKERPKILGKLTSDQLKKVIGTEKRKKKMRERYMPDK